jgi:hypothetical protein
VLKRLAVVLVLMGSLFLALGASAQARDRNSDRLPDRWEKKHGLSLKVKQTRRDQDKDGFNNMAEWKAKSDPRDADSDDDGIEDDQENAGTVKSFENGVLTITLFDGGELTGNVTDATEIECDDDTSVATTKGHDDLAGDDHGDDDGDDNGADDHGDDNSDDNGADDHGDDNDGDDDRGDHEHGDDDDGDDHGDDTCPAGALAAGAAVKEAELKATSAGRIWEKIELR